MVTIKRFDICLVNLDPTVGSEIKKTRPCLVISPDSMNLSRLNTVIVAPLTSTVRDYAVTRINIEFQKRKGQIALDQLRVIDRTRIVKVVGTLDSETICNKVLQVLQMMFT